MTARELIQELLDLPEEQLEYDVVLTKANVNCDEVKAYKDNGDKVNKIRIL